MRHQSFILFFIVQALVITPLFSSNDFEQGQKIVESNDQPTIHVIYIVDTHDRRLNRVNKAIGAKLQVLITNVQQALRAKVQKHYISNRKFNSKDCFANLNDLSIQPLRDLVFLCVVAHGEASTSEEHYPLIRFTDNDKRDFGQIMDLILIQQPAYLVSIVNTCNHFPDRGTSSIEQVTFTDIDQCKLGINGFDVASLKQLFSPVEETIAITFLSAQKESTTRVDKSGGIPFLAFVNSFHHWTSNAREGTSSWGKIILNAQAIAVCKSENEQIDLICPYGEIATISLDPNNNILREGRGFLFCE